ncbi:MAG: hypothetical protein JKX94_03320, partial [Sneathiella sp.]|nr:hypothetical protein [Sneathiella sp.]
DKKEKLQGLSRGLRDPQSMINEKVQHLDHLENRLKQSVTNSLMLKQQKFRNAEAKLRPDILQRGFTQNQERLNNFEGRMNRAIAVHRARSEDRLKSVVRMLESLSFKRVLGRGYSIIQDTDGTVISSVSNAKAGNGFVVRFQDGDASAIFGKGAGKISKPQTKSQNNPATDQGTLL